MIKVCVRWFNGNYEEFECTEMLTGNYYLWLRLTNGQSRYIPIQQVKWYFQSPESYSISKVIQTERE